MNIKKAKVVIWDLDETFWKGTLSEGHVSQIKQNIDVIKELVDRGIMNTIVSKNDFDKAASVLKQWEIFDLFIFPKISWQPKGQVVKALLDEMKLRPENALFIDDNPSNLGEVEFYNNGIFTITPDKIHLILSDPAFQGKDDHEHSRLKQYHLMEQRSLEEAKYNSNEEFLRSSHIQIQICCDCENEFERIYELIQRTNQLNYTKIRCSKEELHELLNDRQVEARYIKVKDRFGNYGITGFYALKNNKLLHFLFSCRTIGFGVENFIYKKLGYPTIDIQAPVTTALDAKLDIDWVTETNDSVDDNQEITERKNRILMVAGCDLLQAANYLESSFQIDKEFTTVIDGCEIRTSDLVSLLNTLKLDDSTKSLLSESLPFINKNITFGTKIFSGDYDWIILSVVDDYIRGIYQHKSDGYYIGVGGYFEPNYVLEKYGATIDNYLKDNFNYVGREPISLFKNNLKEIISNIPQKTNILLINGIDLDVSDWIGQDRVQRNLDMNHAVDNIVSQYSNVYLVDMRSIVTSREMLSNRDNRHYSRQVYYKMAMVIAEMINTLDGGQNLDVVNPYIYRMKQFFYRLFRILKH